MSERVERNRAVIEEFRANHGVVAQFGGVPLLLLTTTGARSGQPRTSPLMYVDDGGGFAVFGTNGGRDIDPAWCRNLDAAPRARVEVGDRTVEVTARWAEGDEHDRLWAKAVEVNPMYADFVAATDRPIPVAVLTPVPS